MKNLIKLSMAIICMCMANIYAQNFQLGVSAKGITNASTLGGDEWDFKTDMWVLNMNKMDLIGKVSNITAKLVNIKLEIKASIPGTTNSISKTFNFENTKAPSGVATVKFSFDFTEVSGLEKKLLFDVAAYTDGVQVGSIRRSVTRK